MYFCFLNIWASRLQQKINLLDGFDEFVITWKMSRPTYFKINQIIIIIIIIK